MAGADKGRLRVGPWVPDSNLEPTDGSPENAVTEIIPIVTDEPADAPEPPTVRGTARRSAAALPALGRKDGPPKVPRSSRSTLDRRDREQKAAAAAGSSAPAGSTSPSADPVARAAAAASPAADSSGPTAADPTEPAGRPRREPRPEPVNPFAGGPPRPRRSPERERSRGRRWPADEPWPEVAAVPGVLRPDELDALTPPDAPTSPVADDLASDPSPSQAGSPVAAAASTVPAAAPPRPAPPSPEAPKAAPSSPAPPKAAPSRPAPPKAAPSRPEAPKAAPPPPPPPPRVPRPRRAPADVPPPAPTEVFVAQLAIDDTAEIDMSSGPASPGLAGGGRARRDEAGAPLASSQRPAAPPARRSARAERAPSSSAHAPSSSDDDRWDREPSGDVANETYQGRRRAKRVLTRPPVLVGLVVLALAGVFTLPFVLRSSPTPPGPTTLDPGTQPAVALPVQSPSDDGEISSTAGPGASASPTRTVARTTTRTSPAAPIVNPTLEPTTPPPTTLAPFTPLTIEAEAGANSVVAPAARSSYQGTSGGQMVGFLGVTQGQSGQGRLVLPAISVPTAGTYTVTFQYVANSNRTAHVIVNGTAAGTVAVPARSECCGTGSLNVTLQAGSNTIEFTNPTARCPAIDRVVITRP